MAARPSTHGGSIDMSKQHVEHPSSAAAAANRRTPTPRNNPSSSSSSPPPHHQVDTPDGGRLVVVGSSPPPLVQTEMAGSAAELFACSTPAMTTKPLTMFYNGGVAVFHLPQDKAEDLIRMAAGEEGSGDHDGLPRRANHGDELLAKLREEMPIASKRSLQRFFQKRKERLYGP